MCTCYSVYAARHEVNISLRSLPRAIRQMSHAASQALAKIVHFMYSSGKASIRKLIETNQHCGSQNPNSTRFSSDARRQQSGASKHLESD
jgi:hypothetical protein